MFNYLLILLLINIKLIICDETDKCGKNCVEGSKNFYDKENNGFIKQYENARSSYKNETCENCECYLNVIENDLKPFQNGITENMLEACTSNRGVRYQLINEKWYRSKDCMFPSRCEGVEYFLINLKNELPNLDLCINFHDWPQIEKHHKKLIPIFSFSKNSDYYDIMYPAWSFWKGGPAIKLIPNGLGRWDLGRISMEKSAEKWPWFKKVEKGFFRGSRTSHERDTIVLFSRENPDLIDAEYTKNQAWKSDEDTLGFPPSDEISLEDHCKYKYLFNFRGVTASFRFKYLFLCKSLVIHVGNDWNEFFYFALKPWIHYVPLSNQATKNSYRKLITFLRNNDEIAKNITKNGSEFIKNNLKLEDIKCYWKKLLKSYSKLIKFTPKLNKKLILVKNQ
ncbi:hypothetical protein O3M35_004700 [Rhynocoris fuscipes]|uniref:Glycosyl transferase CAP10 domain-containing protein n=1 Tax=Rhynocoris fuscipes TaxID=488301 RepID=A0AAW1CFG7_9HEMI